VDSAPPVELPSASNRMVVGAWHTSASAERTITDSSKSGTISDMV
jgi:hypothetical protein